MKKKAMIIGVIIAIFAVITAVSSCYCVKEDEYAYVVRFSKIERIERSARFRRHRTGSTPRPIMR